jgi:hypothetical protein
MKTRTNAMSFRSFAFLHSMASAVGCIGRPYNHLAFARIVGSVATLACAAARSFKHFCLDIVSQFFAKV